MLEDDEWGGRDLTQLRQMIVWQLQALAQDPDDLEDVAQDCLIKLWMHRGSFRHDSKRTTWVYRIVRNKLASWWRREGAWARASSRGSESCGHSQRRDLSEVVIDRVCVHAMLAGTDLLDRRILELIFLAERTSVETGKYLGLAPSSVRSRITRLRAKLGP
jgi:RNA polymerase sigma-70 factor (ECF subfamily)